MTFERITIKKGVNLSAIKTDKFKASLLSVNLLVPLSKTTASKNSLLTDVLQQGTVTYPTMEAINKRKDELYALGLTCHVSKRGEVQYVTFNISPIEDAYAFDNPNLLVDSLELLREIIFCPLVTEGEFKPEYVAREKKNLIDSIKAKINNKTSYAITRCHELMCEGEPFAVETGGDIEEIEKITPRELYDHYIKLLDNCGIEIAYVGSKSGAQVSKLIAEHLPFEERESPRLNTIVKTQVDEVRSHVEVLEVDQCKLSIGMRIGTSLISKNYIKFAMFNELFGGSPGSKLFMNVREKKSLCYYVRPVVEANKGIMVIASGVEKKNKDIAFEAIMEQLQEVRAGNFTDDEMYEAKRSLQNAYKEITDSPGSISSWYLSRIIAGRTDSPMQAAIEADTVTREDIIEMAGRLTLDYVYTLEGNN